MNIRPGSEARLLLPATPDPKFRNDWGLPWSTLVYQADYLLYFTSNLTPLPALCKFDPSLTGPPGGSLVLVMQIFVTPALLPHYPEA